MKMYITIDKKVVHIEGSESEEKELKKRMRKAMYAAAKKERDREADIERRGYCMDCNLLLSMTHKCPKCGTVWNKYRTQH